MQFPRPLLSVMVLLALGLPSSAGAGDESKSSASLGDELHAKYPKPPKTLEADPAAGTVLLVDFDLKGVLAMNAVDGAAMATDVDGSEPIRASALKHRQVMFHTLEPGTYSLKVLRVENYNSTIVLQRPEDLDINVTVAKGDITFLGTVVVKLAGTKPPVWQLVHDTKRELEAWKGFKEKYADSPWAALAEKRIQQIQSQAPPADQK